MPTPRRTALTFLAAVTAIVGLAACGDDDDSSASSSTAPPETEVPDTQVPETDVPSSEVPDTEVPGGSQVEGPTAEAAADIVVGLSEADAEAAAAEEGWTIRVVRRDGEDLPATMDLRPERVNVEVTDGEVTAVVSIG